MPQAFVVEPPESKINPMMGTFCFRVDTLLFFGGVFIYIREIDVVEKGWIEGHGDTTGTPQCRPSPGAVT